MDIQIITDMQTCWSQYSASLPGPKQSEVHKDGSETSSYSLCQQCETNDLLQQGIANHLRSSTIQATVMTLLHCIQSYSSAGTWLVIGTIKSLSPWITRICWQFLHSATCPTNAIVPATMPRTIACWMFKWMATKPRLLLNWQTSITYSRWKLQSAKYSRSVAQQFSHSSQINKFYLHVYTYKQNILRWIKILQPSPPHVFAV